MRVFQPSSLLVLIHARLFFLSFPVAALSSGNFDPGLQVEANRGVAESPSDTTEVDSWASFLNLSHVIDSIKGTFFPLDLDGTASVQPEALAVSGSGAPPPDFWDAVEKYEHIVQDYVPQLLSSAAIFFDSTKFTDIISVMHGIVDTTAAFHDSIQGSLHARDITSDTLTEELEGVFMAIAKDLEKLSLPDKAFGCAEKAKTVDMILDKVATGLEDLFQRLDLEEGVATRYIRAVEPDIHALVVIVCEINELYPCLLPTLAFSVVALLIPQRWLLGQLLSLFGFGPAGPLKGSAAAWLQRFFWGAAVQSGSWFALLQAAGMGVLPSWAGFVTVVPLVGCMLFQTVSELVNSAM